MFKLNALHRYRKGRGFESCSKPECFIRSFFEHFFVRKKSSPKYFASDVLCFES